MSFLTRIKLGNVTNLSDARYAAAVGIEYIGFCFDPASENYIAPIRAKEIIDWITGSNIIAEFGNQTPAEIKDISELLNVDAIEIENNLLPDELPGLGKPVVKKIDAGTFSAEQVLNELQAYHPYCDTFHLYSSSGRHTMSDEQLRSLCATYQVIWGFAVQASEVPEILGKFSPFGINISGGVEEKAGIKDFDELNDLVDLLRTED